MATKQELSLAPTAPQTELCEEAFVNVLAALAAAISLLERGGKKAAPSDRMFRAMLADYRVALDRGRAILVAAKKERG